MKFTQNDLIFLKKIIVDHVKNYYSVNVSEIAKFQKTAKMMIFLILGGYVAFSATLQH